MQMLLVQKLIHGKFYFIAIKIITVLSITHTIADTNSRLNQKSLFCIFLIQKGAISYGRLPSAFWLTKNLMFIKNIFFDCKSSLLRL